MSCYPFPFWVRWLAYVACGLGCWTNAPGQTPPTPDLLGAHRVDPLTETWRWQRLEALERLKIGLACLDAQDRLWLVGENSEIYVYDGATVETRRLPEALGQAAVMSIGATTAGALCLITSESVVWWPADETPLIVPTAGRNRRSFGTISEGADGVVWFATASGVVRVDPRRRESETTATTSYVLSLCESPDRQSLLVSLGASGEVWEGDLVDGRLEDQQRWRRVFSGYTQTVLSSQLLRARDGRIWYINSNHSLAGAVYDAAVGRWELVSLAAVGGDDLASSMLEAADGAVWVAGRGALHAWRDGRWEVYRSPDYPVPGARCQILADRSGYLYLVEVGGATRRIDARGQRGPSYRGLHYQGTTADGEQLFITANNAVLRRGERTILYPPEQTGIDTPVTLKITRGGQWFLGGSIGTTAAVAVFDGQQWQTHRFPGFAASIGRLGILERRNGEIWVGCGQEAQEFPEYQGGVMRFVPRAQGGYQIEHLRPPRVPFRNWNMQETPDGTVYSVGNGLFRILAERFQEVPLPHDSPRPWIDDAAVDAEGNLWLVVWANGVFQLRPTGWEREVVTRGLPNLLLSQIVCPPGSGPLVMGPEGLYRFDGDHWARYLAPVGGLHRGSGQLRAGPGGALWINRAHVGWYYRAQRPTTEAVADRVAFGCAQHLPDLRPPETAWAVPVRELTRENSMVLFPAGHDVWSQTPAEDLEFSYRLNGGPWSTFQSAEQIFLEGLSGGEHRVELRARDSDFNIDPTPQLATFTVLVPLWQQPWFVASVVGVMVVLGALVFLIYRQRVRHILELEAVKMRFFTQVSHELKTPLSLILGPVERLQHELQDSQHQHYLSLIKSNSQRLLLLVNQLLDFRKLQQKQLDYQAEVADFLPFARSCVAVFANWASERKQELAVETSLSSLTFAFDPELFHKILDNLVNNAIKYTPEGGQIRVRIERRSAEGQEPEGVLEVEDDGPGIPAEEVGAVFEPFYRGKKASPAVEGSGVGLALVKELVEVIGGRVELESPAWPKSPQRPGCRFRVSFPLQQYSPVPPPTLAIAKVGESASSAAVAAANGGEAVAAKEPPLVLLIEDNVELREFLAGELRRQFRIEMAVTAEDGLRQARELVPDLVLSDVGLPGMSGFDFARELKADALTSHVPLVLLTALRSDMHKRQAYECGADDFLTKPVSPEILRLKVRNLIETQRHARERVQSRFVQDLRISGLAEAEQVFLDKANRVIEDELGNESFDVVVLAQKMGFSRSAFYRKFSAITNLSPAIYIKTMRLRRAAKLLGEGRLTVTEIAFEVGFADSGYFSRVFKEEYGTSPSDFARLGGKPTAK